MSFTKPLPRVFSSITFVLGIIFSGNTVLAAEEAPAMVDGATTINSQEAKKLYDDGVAFVDPRGDADFEAGRIPEAMQLAVKSPDFTEENLLKLVGKNDPVVFYCNGVKCALSSTACTKAVAWGWTNVYYYREGFPGWKQSGYPVE